MIHLMTIQMYDDTLYHSTFNNITHEISQTILITREFSSDIFFCCENINPL